MPTLVRHQPKTARTAANAKVMPAPQATSSTTERAAEAAVRGACGCSTSRPGRRTSQRYRRKPCLAPAYAHRWVEELPRRSFAACARSTSRSSLRSMRRNISCSPREHALPWRACFLVLHGHPGVVPGLNQRAAVLRWLSSLPFAHQQAARLRLQHRQVASKERSRTSSQHLAYSRASRTSCRAALASSGGAGGTRASRSRTKNTPVPPSGRRETAASSAPGCAAANAARRVDTAQCGAGAGDRKGGGEGQRDGARSKRLARRAAQLRHAGRNVCMTRRASSQLHGRLLQAHAVRDARTRAAGVPQRGTVGGGAPRVRLRAAAAEHDDARARQAH